MKQNSVQKGDIEKKCNCKESQKKIQELALSIDKVEDEKLVIQNQLKRALADYHNLLANNEKRQKIEFFQMKKSLVGQFLPSLDAMKLAIESSKDLKPDQEEKAWIDGIFATFETISKALEGIGLKSYLPEIGDMFDASIHEALATVEGNGSGKIVEVVQPGYTLDDTVIRDSKVIVSK